MNHRHAIAFLRQSKELVGTESRFETYVAAGFAVAGIVVLYAQFGGAAKTLYRMMTEG